MGGVAHGADRETQHDDQAARGAEAGAGAERVQGPGEQAVQAVLAGGGGAPDVDRIAAILSAYPGERDAIVHLLNRTVGMSYTNRLLQTVQGGAAGPGGPAVAAGPSVTDGTPVSGEFAEENAAGPAVTTIPLSVKPAQAVSSTVDPHTRPAPLSNQNYLSNYTLLGSQTTLDTYKATDKKTEAPLLNAVRASNHRFTPDWMLALQKQLHVRETGAFNTDTLRAVRAANPAVTDADFLSDTGVLAALVPGGGSPFTSIGAGFGKLGQGSAGTVSDATHLADAGARGLGYPNYAALHGDLQPIKFLGVAVRGRAHPHLAARLKLAEAWIQQRHGKDAKPQDVGWGPKDKPDAVASYSDSVDDINANNGPTKGPHLHAYGVAIDFDPDHNPFVFSNWKQDPAKAEKPEDKKAIENNNWWVEMFEREFALAARIYGGEAITADKMATWSEQMSTEELFARLDQASKSFKSLLELGQYGSDQEIDDILIGRLKMPPAEAQSTKHELRGLAKKGYARTGRFFNDFMGREQAASITTHSNELLIALRDVAGLAWGGTEMSHPVNGDFMHFDIRQDPLGQQALDFALANRNVSTEKKPTDKKP